MSQRLRSLSHREYLCLMKLRFNPNQSGFFILNSWGRAKWTPGHKSWTSSALAMKLDTDVVLQEKFKKNTLQFQIIGREVLIKGGDPTDNLNINKRGVQIKRGGLRIVIRQKWQPVITNYGCPKRLLIVEKHKYNFSCSLHLYIKQNRTLLITNLTNINTNSCLRSQTLLCIHLLVLLVLSCSLTRCFWGILLNQKISLYIILTSNVKINRICMRNSKSNIRMI